MRKTAILVVDDEEMIRMTVCGLFEDEGFEVFSVPSGEDGLNLLEKEEIDFCTVDMRLPGMTGNEFIVKAHALKPELKFLVYTGSANYVLPRELSAIGIGKQDVFKKPVEDLTVLVDTVNRAVRRD